MVGPGKGGYGFLQFIIKKKDIGIKSMNNMVTIQITDEEAKQFVCFRKYYESVSILIDFGFFNIKNGKAIVDFSHESRIMSVESSTKLYKRKRHDSIKA